MPISIFRAGAFGPEDRAILDGNSLPHAPEWISNITLRYTKELAEGGEICFEQRAASFEQIF